jgi:hypothetical protein
MFSGFGVLLSALVGGSAGAAVEGVELPSTVLAEAIDVELGRAFPLLERLEVILIL